MPDLPRFDAVTRAPRRRAPAGAVDCHMHVFGPAGRYPWSPARGYTPPDALLEDYALVQQRLGLERVVVVQPSVYGTDNRCTCDAVVRLGPDKARGVAVVAPEVSEAELARLHGAGFRGARLNLISPGGVPLDGVDGSRPRSRRTAGTCSFSRAMRCCSSMPGGWRRCRSTWCSTISARSIFPTGRSSRRCGRCWICSGVGHLGQALRRLPGRSWRRTLACGETVRRGLLKEAPERLVWGTDWPHPGPPGPMPDAGDLLDALWDWCRDEVLYRKILVDNPARLYGFS